MGRFGWHSALFLLLIAVEFTGSSSNYDVHWLAGPTTIERDGPSMKKAVDIYCYSGTDKNLLALWQTVKFHIKIKSDDFSQYTGGSPEDVFAQYSEDNWAKVLSFQRKYRTLSLDLFTPTCLALNTKEKHSIELHVQRVDLWRVLVMVGGAALVASSRALSANALFFYLCGALLGVGASFMLLVYYVSKLLPRKTLTYGVLIGGWTVGVYVLQRAWDNARSLVADYGAWLAWYALLAALASMAVCYRLGPPRDRRTRDLVMWTLQGIGALLIFFSSQYQEASAAVAIITLGVKYFPRSLLYRIQGYWRRRFPPKPQLLSDAQYYEQGARETRRALDALRQHCAAGGGGQWRLVRTLRDAKRFASFVEGDSHLSDEEVLDYESYAFSLDRKRSTPPRSRSRSRTPAGPSRACLDISDDESHSDES